MTAFGAPADLTAIPDSELPLFDVVVAAIMQAFGKPMSSQTGIGLNARQQLIIGAWRSLVAHLVWDQGAGGSNPSAPTLLYNI